VPFKSIITSLSKCGCDLFYPCLILFFHPSPYKVPFKSITSLSKCRCDLFYPCLIFFFIHHLTKCHSKVIITSLFQNAQMYSIMDVSQNFHPSPYKLPFKSNYYITHVHNVDGIESANKLFIHPSSAYSQSRVLFQVNLLLKFTIYIPPPPLPTKDSLLNQKCVCPADFFTLESNEGLPGRISRPQPVL
jgi:hypothetical protein